ncbi:hypothetical protein GCM10010347_45450 [Streptomyces cirratus]|uniref:Uncharacterized protein n=1 Tax=Streptomyces cirratus TaxID=68187 RepID=A0ABQ3EWZ0_9ACTN|nr:hypothetical protein GCM10010347_45450 [Streptomyces cirratus]
MFRTGQTGRHRRPVRPDGLPPRPAGGAVFRTGQTGRHRRPVHPDGLPPRPAGGAVFRTSQAGRHRPRARPGKAAALRAASAPTGSRTGRPGTGERRGQGMLG